MIQKEILLSIVIPVYNVENYLRQCLDSLVKQADDLIQIICVNDSSTDNSLKILEEYEKKYSFIEIVTQKNGGLSAARNTGLEYVKGKYICFLDSDDFVEDNYINEFISSARSNDSDIVICDFNYYWDENSSKNYLMEGLNKKYPNLKINKRAIISSMFAWNKLFKYDFFKSMNQRFVVGTWYEDIEVISYLFAKAPTISYVNKALINYRQRNTSIMGTKSKRCEEIFAVLERTYDKFKANNLLEEYKNELEYMFIEQLLIYGQFRFLLMDNYRELLNRAKQFIKKRFPNYLNNIYLKDQSLKYQVLVLFNNRLTVPLFKAYLLRNEK